MPLEATNPTLRRYLEEFIYPPTVTEPSEPAGIGSEFYDQEDERHMRKLEELKSSEACRLLHLNTAFRV